jgi:hypothetical protein
MTLVKKLHSNVILTIQESVGPSETRADQRGKEVTPGAEAGQSEGYTAAVKERGTIYAGR